MGVRRILERPLPTRRFALVLVCITCLGVSLWLFRTSFFDRSVPTVEAENPVADEFGVAVSTPIRVTFRKAMEASAISRSTFWLRDSNDRLVPATVSYQSNTYSATLKPIAPLAYSTTFRVTLRGGPSGVLDRHGKALGGDVSRSFTTGAPPPPPPAEGPGGPILVIASSSNPFSLYYAEILRNEGFNEFAVADISSVTAATLEKYDLAILGEFPLARERLAMLADWVRGGGNLIAMRPDKALARQAGLKG